MATLSEDGTKLVDTVATEKDIPAMYRSKVYLQGLLDRYAADTISVQAELDAVQADIDAAIAAGYVPE